MQNIMLSAAVGVGNASKWTKHMDVGEGCNLLLRMNVTLSKTALALQGEYRHCDALLVAT